MQVWAKRLNFTKLAYKLRQICVFKTTNKSSGVTATSRCYISIVRFL